MNYKAGDTVLCIDAKVLWLPTHGLVAGQKYVVAFTDGKNCTAVEGVRNPEARFGYCAECHNETQGLCHFLPSRFIKLDDLTEEQEQHQLDEALT